MSLPPALAKWLPALELLEPHLALALAPVLRRLDLLFGAWEGSAAYGDGAPDGYDGITRRGSFDRLLASEWLLADEVPDEFLRRAATSTLSFYALARATPRAGRKCTVLVDVGPEMLGTPRVASFAAWVVLRARVVAAGGSFAWAIAQQADDEPRDDLGIAAIRRITTVRAAARVEHEAIVERTARARAEGEVWILTGTRGGAVATAVGASAFEVEDVLDPTAWHLAVAARRGRRGVRTAVLPLPPPATCVRLLRAPVAPPRARTMVATQFSLAKPTILPSRIALAREGGGWLVIPSPHATAQEIAPGRVLTVDDRGEVFALGVPSRDGSIVVLAQRDDVLSQVKIGGKRLGRRIAHLGHAREPLRPKALDGRLCPVVALQGCPTERTYFIGRSRTLFEFRPGARAEIVAAETHAMLATAPTTMAYARLGGGEVSIVERFPSGQEREWHRAPVDEGETFLSRAPSSATLLAAYPSTGSWTVATITRANEPDGRVATALERMEVSDDEVIGVTGGGALVTFNHALGRLSTRGERGGEALTLAESIAELAMGFDLAVAITKAGDALFVALAPLRVIATLSGRRADS